jgi:fibronectin-binding autotransporter adhesin
MKPRKASVVAALLAAVVSVPVASAQTCTRTAGSSQLDSVWVCPVSTEADFDAAVARSNSASGYEYVSVHLLNDLTLATPVNLTDSNIVLAPSPYVLSGAFNGSFGPTLWVTKSIDPFYPPTSGPNTVRVTGPSNVYFFMQTGSTLLSASNIGSVNGYGGVELNGGTFRALGSLTLGALFVDSYASTPACIGCSQPLVATVDTNGHDVFVYETLGTSGLNKVGAGKLTFERVDGGFLGPMIVGGGTLQLNDRYLYGAILTLDGGELRAGTDLALSGGYRFGEVSQATLGAGGGTVDTNGFTITFAGVAGPGGLTKLGAGTLAIEGVASYLGPTSVRGGTLRLGSNSALPSTTALEIAAAATVDARNRTIAVAELRGLGTLAIDRGSFTVAGDGPSEFDGAITGDGQLIKSGAGTFTLAGPNTYSGGTTVSAGTLSGTTTSLKGKIANAATLTFDQGGAGVFTGSITGNGVVNKTGAGAVFFAQPQVYTGLTHVMAGQLDAGMLAGSVAVDADAAFGASHVGGDLFLATGATLVVDTGAAPAAVAGRATVGGATVALMGSAPSSARISTLPFLTAGGGFAGTFGDVISSAPLAGVARTDGNTAFLILERTDLALASLATTTNGRTVGSAFDALRAAGGESADLNRVFLEIGALPDAQVSGAFTDLANRAAPTALLRAAGDGQDVLRSVNDRIVDVTTGAGERTAAIASASGADRSGFWVKSRASFGASPEVTSSGGAIGWLAGFDRALARGIVLGAFAGYDPSSATIDTTALSDHAVRAGGYLSGARGQFFLTAALSGASHRFRTNRHVQIKAVLDGSPIFGGIDRMATARFDGTDVSGYGEAGMTIETGVARLQPLVSIDATRIWSDPFAETGAGAIDLRAASASASSAEAAIGLRALRTMRGSRLTPRVEARYLHQLARPLDTMQMAWQDASALPLSIDSVRSNINAVSFATGVALSAKPGLLLSVDYRGTFGAAGQRQVGSLGFGF